METVATPLYGLLPASHLLKMSAVIHVDVSAEYSIPRKQLFRQCGVFYFLIANIRSFSVLFMLVQNVLVRRLYFLLRLQSCLANANIFPGSILKNIPDSSRLKMSCVSHHLKSIVDVSFFHCLMAFRSAALFSPQTALYLYS